MTDTTKKTEQEARNNMAAKFSQLDFTGFNYINQNTPGIVTCREHGVRLRSYKDVMRSKYGCDLCSGTGIKARKTTEEVLIELEGLYGSEVFSKYDFSKVEYINARSPIVIVCPDHGENHSSMNELLTRRAKTPCKLCNIQGRISGQYDTAEIFVAKGSALFPELDSYEKVNYLNSKTDVIITCLANPLHGDYIKRPNDYLQGQRCPRCSLGQSSSPQQALSDFVRSLGVFVADELRFRNGMKPDIVVPEYNLAIEYHGLYWHSEERKGKRDCVDRLEYFKSIDMDLIQVFEDEWLTRPEVVKRRISSRLGISSKVYARNTIVMRISTSMAKGFLDENHLQGGTHNASHAYGLFYNGILVSVATFSKPRSEPDRVKGVFEIIRYASTLTVVGGFSKLLTAFIRDKDPARIITYADRRWSEGAVYGVTGFTKVSNTDPGYFWCKAQTRYSRWNFQRHKLRVSAEFALVYFDNKKEDEMCQQLGYFKVWDCGHSRWELKLK